MNVNFHSPVSARARTAFMPPEAYGVLTLTDQNGSEIVIYTSASAAHAMAKAFNAELADQEPA